MDYLKSKVVRAESPSSSEEEEEEEEESEDEAVNCDEGSEAEEEDPCAAPIWQGQERTGPGPEQRTLSGTKKPQEASATVCGSGCVLGARGAGGGFPMSSPSYPAGPRSATHLSSATCSVTCACTSV